jgi:hypothetical protein
VDRILDLFNATKLTNHQAKLLLERVRVLIELGKGGEQGDELKDRKERQRSAEPLTEQAISL